MRKKDKRLTISINPEVVKKMRAIQKKRGFVSLIVAIRNAFALYMTYSDVIDEGGKFVVHKSDGSKETIREF